MTERIATARPRETSLDVSPADLEQLASGVSQMVTEYFSRISTFPVFPDVSGGDTLGIIGASLPMEGEPVEQLLNACRAVLEGSRHPGHPRFFGYVASPSTPAGAFADLLASALNGNVTSWRSGPAATEIERTVVRWLGALVGYGEDSQGLLTSGGSMANMTALLIAHRSHAEPDVAWKGISKSALPMTIYASDQIHMSIPKAADILGLGREQVRIVESDQHFRLDVRRLRERIASDQQKGMKPFCVVASSGTVNTGAVDPLFEIAEVAGEFGLWFHVDGAYGALGSLDDSKRPLFAGIERADSVSLDPHKWLYVPLDAGCLLFRDEARARAAFAFDEADYIKVHEQHNEEAFAFWNYGPELSRRFRALKIWMTLRYYGARHIAAAISEDIALARYLGRRVEQADDFALLAPIELSICCFRYVPESFRERRASGEPVDTIDAELDELNSRIMNLVQRGGRAYISSAAVRGKFALRACITNFRTTRNDIDQTLEIIRDAAREVLRHGDGSGSKQ